MKNFYSDLMKRKH